MSELKVRDVNTIWGTKIQMYYRNGTNDTLVINSVLESDEYQAKNINYKDGDIFIDLGAHIGTWSILMGLKNPTFKVYSFEAIPDNYEILKKNIEITGVKNVFPFLLAVSDESDKPVNIYHTANDTPFNIQHRFIGSMNGSGEHYQTQSISMNDIFERNDIQKCKVVKTDCEGCELRAFPSLAPEHMRKIEYIIGEYHPVNMGIEKFYGVFKSQFDALLPLQGDHLQNFVFKNREM